MLERDLSRLDVFHRLGVRIIQLTYNDRNIIGDGCLEPGDAGLSAYGRQVVERMNALGIAVDLSHCGTRTTADGIAASTKPPLITHSGCREVYRHPRSKEDRELKAMADKGGVLGIYFMPFIGQGTGAPTVEMLMRQIDHALKVCGADHVGIGSDLSTAPIEETPEYLREPRRSSTVAPRAASRRRTRSRPLFIPELNHPRRIEGVAARDGASAAIPRRSSKRSSAATSTACSRTSGPSSRGRRSPTWIARSVFSSSSSPSSRSTHRSSAVPEAKPESRGPCSASFAALASTRISRKRRQTGTTLSGSSKDVRRGDR